MKQLSAQIHENAQRFIIWLQEAEEEESDEEDDEDEDVEVVYDERSRPDKIIEVKEVAKPLAKPTGAIAAVKEDDIDIDAI